MKSLNLKNVTFTSSSAIAALGAFAISKNIKSIISLSVIINLVVLLVIILGNGQTGG